MKKIMILITLLTLMIACPAHSQNFEVKTVDVASKEVVLQDKNTGEEWLAREGDEVEGWKIMAITSDYVSIAKIDEEMESVMTQLPVNGGGRLIRMTPQPLAQ